MLFANVLCSDLDALKITCKVVADPDNCKEIFTPQHNFKLLSLNIRSILKNSDSLFVLLKRLDVSIDILVLTECWLSDSIIIPQLPGYCSYKTSRNINQNSGVVVYVKDKWNASVSEPLLDDADSLNICIPKVLNVLGIYRSPSIRNLEKFLTSLETYICNLNNLPLIIAGDLNINIMDTLGNPQSLEYQCFMAEHGLLPAVSQPTREDSCLDHIYVKSLSSGKTAVGAVCQTAITDHYPVLLGYNTSRKFLNRPNRFVIKRDFDAIQSDLSNVDWSIVTDINEVNNANESFTEILVEIVNKHSKEIKISRSKYNLRPWITPGLMKCMRIRDRLHLQARRDPENLILRKTYTRYQNFFVDLLRKLKLDFENRELIANKNDSKKLWRSIQSICNLTQQKKEPIELLSLQGCPESQKSIDITNNHFSTIGQRLADQILLRTNKCEEELARSVNVKNSPSDSIFLNPIDSEEIDKIIINLKNDKAPGIDGFGNALIKFIRIEIMTPLTHILNLSLSTGIFPHNWKIALVSPIHKSGPKDSVDNYRPISLLGTFSKLLEKLVNKRLVSFLESHKLISPKQFGFRKGKSTEDAVTLLTTTVSSNLDNGKCCVGIFLDLAKAFDTVSVPILLQKLEGLGIRGVALDWFRSYLTDRRQCVRIGQITSQLKPIRFGVPQGSILGPTLFLLYINDIHDVPIDDAEILCYADDTAVIFNGPSWPEVYLSAERGMALINAWLQNNLLTLNTKKTMYLSFHKTAASAPDSIANIKVHSSKCTDLHHCTCDSLTRTVALKYLGVHIDQNLNFKIHIDLLSARIRKVINIMRNLRYVACFDTLKTVYYALCQSLICYCITCWGCAAKSFLIQAERAQRSVLKVMLRRPYRYPTTSLFRDAGVLTVRQLFIQKSSLLVHKSAISSPEFEFLSSRRVYRLITPSVKTKFAQRIGNFIKIHVYNNVVKNCDIKNKSVSEAKHIVFKWLLSLTYDDTEEILGTTC